MQVTPHCEVVCWEWVAVCFQEVFSPRPSRPSQRPLPLWPLPRSLLSSRTEHHSTHCNLTSEMHTHTPVALEGALYNTLFSSHWVMLILSEYISCHLFFPLIVCVCKVVGCQMIAGEKTVPCVFPWSLSSFSAQCSVVVSIISEMKEEVFH